MSAKGKYNRKFPTKSVDPTRGGKSPAELALVDGVYVATSTVNPSFMKLMATNGSFVDMRLDEMLSNTTSMVDGTEFQFDSNTANSEPSPHWNKNMLHGFHDIDGPRYTPHGTNGEQQSRLVSHDAGISGFAETPNSRDKNMSRGEHHVNFKQSEPSPLGSAPDEALRAYRPNSRGSGSPTIQSPPSIPINKTTKSNSSFVNRAKELLSSPVAWLEMWESYHFQQNLAPLLADKDLLKIDASGLLSVEKIGPFIEHLFRKHEAQSAEQQAALEAQHASTSHRHLLRQSSLQSLNQPAILTVAEQVPAVVLEVIGLAVIEKEQAELIEENMAAAKHNASVEVEHILRKDLANEQEKQNRVIGLAQRTLNSRFKVAENKDKMLESLKEKELVAAERLHIVAERQKARILESQTASSKVQMCQEEHKLARMERISEETDRIMADHSRQQAKRDIVERMQDRMDQEARDRIRRHCGEDAVNKNSPHLELVRAEVQNFRDRSKESLMIKEERSLNHREQVKAQWEESVRVKQERDGLLKFRAEKRRELLEKERLANLEAMRVEVLRQAVTSDMQKSIKIQRTHALQAVYENQFASAGLNTTAGEPPGPGPGEYFQEERPRRILGGVLAGRGTGPFDRNMNPGTLITPGPGQYEKHSTKSAVSASGSGVLPFMGRGKTDVDWSMATAAQQPGPGSYNLPGGNTVGGHFSRANPPKELERVAMSKSYIPGVGSYDIAPTSHGQEPINSDPSVKAAKQTQALSATGAASLRLMSRAQGMEERVTTEFATVFETMV